MGPARAIRAQPSVPCKVPVWSTQASASGPINVFSVFDALTLSGNELDYATDQVLSTGLGLPVNETLAPGGTSRTATSIVSAAGLTTFNPAPNLSPGGLMHLPLAGLTVTSVATNFMSGQPGWSTAQPMVNGPTTSDHFVALQRTDHDNVPVPSLTRFQTGLVPDSVLDDMATEAILVRSRQGGSV